MNYFDIRKVSASFLSSVEKLIRYNLKELPVITPTESMDLGTFIDKCVEEPSYYDKLVFAPKINLTPTELKVAEDGCTVESYLANYNNKVTKDAEKGDKKSIDIVTSKVEGIKEVYRNHQEELNRLREDKVLLNDYFTNVEKAYEQITECSRNTRDFIESLNLSDIEYQKVVEWEYNGVKCKSMLDLYTPDTVYDIKTYSNNIYDNIKKYRYIRQLSFYCEAVGAKNAAIIAVNTSTYQVSLIEFTAKDLMYAKKGGFYKEHFMTKGNAFYMNEQQSQTMFDLGFWEEGLQDEKLIPGWEFLLNYAKENRLI